MSIAMRAPLPRFVQKGRQELLVPLLFNDSGERKGATGGTFTLLDSAGDVVVSGAVSVSNGLPFYTLLSTFADDYDLPQHPWQERWELEGLTGEAFTTGTFENEVMVCRVAPTKRLALQDLYDLHSSWPQQVSRARSEPGTYIETAWVEMVRRMLGQGLVPSRTLNWWAFATVHKYWTAALICRDFHADTFDNVWGKLADDYWKRSQDEYKEAGAQLDSDEDGVADEPGKLDTVEPQLFLTSLPARGYWDRS